MIPLQLLEFLAKAIEIFGVFLANSLKAGCLQEKSSFSSFEEESWFLIIIAKRSNQMPCKKSALYLCWKWARIFRLFFQIALKQAVCKKKVPSHRWRETAYSCKTPFTRRFARKVLFNQDRNEQESPFFSCELTSIGNLQEGRPSSLFEEEKCFLFFLA